VRATSRCGDQVDVTFAHRLTVLGKGDTPGQALTFGKTLMLGVGKALALKQRDDRLTGQGLGQVVAQTALV